MNREEFHARAMIAAMQGMMSLDPPDMVRWSGVGSDKGFPTVAHWVADNCASMADALAAEWEKSRPYVEDRDILKKAKELAEGTVDSGMDEMTAYAYGYLHGVRGIE